MIGGAPGEPRPGPGRGSTPRGPARLIGSGLGAGLEIDPSKARERRADAAPPPCSPTPTRRKPAVAPTTGPARRMIADLAAQREEIERGQMAQAQPPAQGTTSDLAARMPGRLRRARLLAEPRPTSRRSRPTLVPARPELLRLYEDLVAAVARLNRSPAGVEALKLSAPACRRPAAGPAAATTWSSGRAGATRLTRRALIGAAIRSVSGRRYGGGRRGRRLLRQLDGANVADQLGRDLVRWGRAGSPSARRRADRGAEAGRQSRRRPRADVAYRRRPPRVKEPRPRAAAGHRRWRLAFLAATGDGRPGGDRRLWSRRPASGRHHRRLLADLGRDLELCPAWSTRRVSGRANWRRAAPSVRDAEDVLDVMWLVGTSSAWLADRPGRRRGRRAGGHLRRRRRCLDTPGAEAATRSPTSRPRSPCRCWTYEDLLRPPGEYPASDVRRQRRRVYR